MPKTPPKKLVKRPVVIPQADNRTIASAGILGAIRRTERFFMKKIHSFKFLDNTLNQRLVILLKRSKVDHSIDENGVIHYSVDDQEVVENELICEVRDKVFKPWQILTFPNGWTERYLEYMARRGIPFREELSDGELWLLLPKRYRPHSWKLENLSKKESLARSA
jgi:hypothetical protein